MTSFKTDRSEILEDGGSLRVPMLLADSAAAEGVRDTARQIYLDHLATAWQGVGAVVPDRNAAEAAMAASMSAAEAAQQRLADSRPDAASAHAAMVAHLNDAWRP